MAASADRRLGARRLPTHLSSFLCPSAGSHWPLLPIDGTSHRLDCRTWGDMVVVYGSGTALQTVHLKQNGV